MQTPGATLSHTTTTTDATLSHTTPHEFDFDNNDDAFYNFIEFGIASNGGRLSIKWYHYTQELRYTLLTTMQCDLTF